MREVYSPERQIALSSRKPKSLFYRIRSCSTAFNNATSLVLKDENQDSMTAHSANNFEGYHKGRKGFLIKKSGKVAPPSPTKRNRCLDHIVHKRYLCPLSQCDYALPAPIFANRCQNIEKVTRGQLIDPKQ